MHLKVPSAKWRPFCLGLNVLSVMSLLLGQYHQLYGVSPFYCCYWVSAYFGQNFQKYQYRPLCAYWRHQIEPFSALLALWVGNSPITSEFPSQRPVTRSFDVFFDLRLNKRLSKQSRRRWFETPSLCPLWRHCSGVLCRAATLYKVLRLISQMLPKSIVGYIESIWAQTTVQD